MKKTKPSSVNTKQHIYKTEKGKRTRLSFFMLLKRGVMALVCVAVLGAFCLVAADRIVVSTTADSIDNDMKGGGYDCIIVLGAGVREDGSMSDMLRDRMDTGISLYFDGVAPKIIVSGDHGRVDYDEVNTMKAYAVECGVESSDVFMDHAGFSTYESIVRAKEIFGVERAVIVTQKYHLYRALYIADYCGIEAVGASADVHTYRGQSLRDAREILARANDCIKRFTRPKPTYLGEAISITSDGDVTNDK